MAHLVPERPKQDPKTRPAEHPFRSKLRNFLLEGMVPLRTLFKNLSMVAKSCDTAGKIAEVSDIDPCGCSRNAKASCRAFFYWYNQHHHHLGIGLMTPDQVHFGQANYVYDARQATLTQAFQANPERFVNKPPQPPQLPTAVRINPPSNSLQTQA